MVCFLAMPAVPSTPQLILRIGIPPSFAVAVATADAVIITQLPKKCHGFFLQSERQQAIMRKNILPEAL
jgi:hypothetical protein